MVVIALFLLMKQRKKHFPGSQSSWEPRQREMGTPWTYQVLSYPHHHPSHEVKSPHEKLHLD